MSSSYLNVCRLCAGSCEKSVPIFENVGSLDFPEKIRCYLHVEIKNSNDADEPRMCSACYEKIINWDRYAERVRKAQGMFMSLAVANGRKADEEGQADGGPHGRQAAERGREERRKGKPRRGRKAKKTRKDDSDFSEEDELPLANHLDSSLELSSQNGSDAKEAKKVKPKIKLKIKAIRERLKEMPREENPEEGRDEDDDEEEEEEEDEEDEEDEEEGATGEPEEGKEEKTSDEDDPQARSCETKTKAAAAGGGLLSLFAWECMECHAPVKNWNALVKHCKEAHASNAAVQCVCGKFLQSRASIVKHRMKHTIGYGYRCEFENCNKTFHRQQLLDVHSLSHMPKELQPWMCCKCSRRFHTESLLKQHEKVHLPKEEKLIHPCQVCQKKFCSKSAVSAHVRAVHFGERPFVCDQCGHSFTSKGILHEHLTIHSDVYNFHCKDCNKSFKTKYRLKIHMDTHVETRYQCPVCTLTLNTRRTLRMHLLVHRDDKAFQCTTCGKAFKRSKDLKNHYNLHTGRRPYTCPFCQRTFANGSNCRSHKRRMHPEELRMYEAALAAGQKPVLRTEEDRPPVEDSTESKSDASNEAKPEKAAESVDSSGPASVPLNLQRDRGTGKQGKQEADAEGEEAPGLQAAAPAATADDHVAAAAADATQIAFTSQPQNVQYAVHQNFYAFQSTGIPAFPGNPFFRQ